jgi:hypothetical protein
MIWREYVLSMMYVRYMNRRIMHVLCATSDMIGCNKFLKRTASDAVYRLY